MDPVSHVLFGGTIAAAMRPPRRAGLTAALVLGSILPDIDAALVSRGFDVYLRAHQSGTHSLAGGLVEAALLAAVLRAVVPGSRFRVLCLAALAGVMGHIGWDLADGSDIALLAPLSGRVFGWHLVSMAEPAVLAPMLVAAGVIWRWPTRARAAAAAALLALTAVLAAKGLSQVRARRVYGELVDRGAPANAVATIPSWGRLFGWTIDDRTGDRVRSWQVDVRRHTLTLRFARVDAPPSAVVLASHELPVVRTFLARTGIPFVRTERDAEGRQLVLWSDVRTCSARACDLAFGGAFDDAATPLYEVIQIGGFRQVRPVPAARSSGHTP